MSCDHVSICSPVPFTTVNTAGIGINLFAQCLSRTLSMTETVTWHRLRIAWLTRLFINSRVRNLIILRQLVSLRVRQGDLRHIACPWHREATIHRSMWALGCMEYCSLQAHTREVAACWAGVVAASEELHRNRFLSGSSAMFIHYNSTVSATICIRDLSLNFNGTSKVCAFLYVCCSCIESWIQHLCVSAQTAALEQIFCPNKRIGE